MGKNDMIRAAYLRYPEGWGENWGDDGDENMRDCLSAQALNVLATVEGEAANYIRTTKSLEHMEAVCRKIARKNKPGNFTIWGDRKPDEPEAAE